MLTAGVRLLNGTVDTLTAKMPPSKRTLIAPYSFSDTRKYSAMVSDSGMVVSEGAEVKNEISNEEVKLVVVASESEVKEIAVLTESKKKKNQILVSNIKKPFFYYYNLSKRYIKQYNEVELSALGMAIPTVVTIAEILKKNGLASEKKLTISSVRLKNGENDRLVMKPKIEITLVNAEKIKNITIATTED